MDLSKLVEGMLDGPGGTAPAAVPDASAAAAKATGSDLPPANATTGTVVQPVNNVLPGAPSAMSKLNAAVTSSQAQVAASFEKAQGRMWGSSAFISVAGCTPVDADELRAMLEDYGCPVITLVPRTNYSIEEQLVIRRRVTIQGRPLGIPIIDGHNSSRV